MLSPRIPLDSNVIVILLMDSIPVIGGEKMLIIREAVDLNQYTETFDCDSFKGVCCLTGVCCKSC